MGEKYKNKKINIILEELNNKVHQINLKNITNNICYYKYDTPAYIKYHLTLLGDILKRDNTREEFFLGNTYSSCPLLENKINKYNLVNPYNKVCIKKNILSQGVELSNYNKEVIIQPDQSQDNIFRIPNLYTNFKDIHYYLTDFSNKNINTNFYTQLLEIINTLDSNYNINYYDCIITRIEGLENKNNTNKESYYQTLSKVLQYMHIYEYRLLNSTDYNYIHNDSTDILQELAETSKKTKKNKKWREKSSSATQFVKSALSLNTDIKIPVKKNIFEIELERCSVEIDNHINVWVSTKVKHGLVIFYGGDFEEKDKYHTSNDLNIILKNLYDNPRFILNKFIYLNFIHKHLSSLNCIITFSGFSFGGTVAKYINSNIDRNNTEYPYLVITYNQVEYSNKVMTNEFSIFTTNDISISKYYVENYLNQIVYNYPYKPILSFFNKHSLRQLKPLFLDTELSVINRIFENKKSYTEILNNKPQIYPQRRKSYGYSNDNGTINNISKRLTSSVFPRIVNSPHYKASPKRRKSYTDNKEAYSSPKPVKRNSYIQVKRTKKQRNLNIAKNSKILGNQFHLIA